MWHAAPWDLAPMPPKHGLEDELYAKIRDGQDAEAAQSPSNRRAPAPPESDAPDQEHAEQQPRNEGQNGLLHQVLREQIGDEDETREQRQGQQAKARSDETKHDFLERVERRHAAGQVSDATRAQTPIEKHQQ